MKIQVRYFAVFRERLGTDTETLELDDGSNVAGALDALELRHPAVAALRGRFRVAVNQEMVGDEQLLNDGDELVLIPPVAGGAGRGPRHAVVLDEPLSIDRVVAAVAHRGAGGLVTFTGMVRDRSQGRDVVRLEYEAYAEMAEAVFRRLCDEIEAELPGVRIAVEHRIGVLAIGDVAVIIAASAPHRAAAFTATRAMIDRLKDQAPIWKKEVGPDGSEWVGLGP